MPTAATPITIPAGIRRLRGCPWAATTPSTPRRPERQDPIDFYVYADQNAFYAALEFWSAMHGFVLLEMTGVMDGIDTDAVFTDMVVRLAAGMEAR